MVLALRINHCRSGRREMRRMPAAFNVGRHMRKFQTLLVCAMPLVVSACATCYDKRFVTVESVDSTVVIAKHVVLYAHSDSEVILLALKHQRQLVYSVVQ